MNEKNFRTILEQCLDLIRQGSSVEAVLAANPQHAGALAPFLRSADSLRRMSPPQSTSQAMARARNRLLERVEAGTGKESIMQGIWKFANVAAVAVAALFVASMGIVAASGGDILGIGGDDDGVRFNARVVSMAPTLFYVQREDDSSFVYLNIGNGTRFQDASGHDMDRGGVHRNDGVCVDATPDRPRFFNARGIRLGACPGPEPMHEATPKPEPTDEATPKPEPTPADETPKAEPTHEPTPKPTPATTPKPEPTAAPKAEEWWGVVTAITEQNMTINKEAAVPTTVWTSGETEFPNGFPLVGAKVWVLGTKNADGSYNAQRITVKLFEFCGTLQAHDGTWFVVSVDGFEKSVNSNEQTAFPNGMPEPGDLVCVTAYKMGDGSYLAKTISIKPSQPTVFTGVIVAHMPGEFTIHVQVGDFTKVVCYEFADVVGTLEVGATVEVQVDHTDGSTYFASLVKVLV